MDRFYKYLLIVSILGLSWLGMMAVHEFGHCLHAWMSGGNVSKVVLHPLVISRTDLFRNPHPLFVAWGGAVIGTLVPFALFVVVAMCRFSLTYIFRFFAGFCLIINGIYIAEDSIFKAGDGGDMIRYGTPQWVLIAFGIVTISLGIYLWNGLGPYFGFTKSEDKVNTRVALGAFGVFLFSLATLILIDSR